MHRADEEVEWIRFQRLGDGLGKTGKPVHLEPETQGHAARGSSFSLMCHILDVGRELIVPHGPTGRFAGRTGTVRLSGAVGMAEFPDRVVFNCIFVVDLD